ncbi:hypothetical protein [Promicromonospora iranensis]|uniref:DUF5666 domain-containing protein n=1 Tax=Promicromonospora iranensis TaxID=1105144 RepID=A0ABU2CHK8_9MICO|nr:hypothetical protein [Promicromonospora iranensis]MDR7380797.1 hypothetical protein [Promicromonospora iranensis]
MTRNRRLLAAVLLVTLVWPLTACGDETPAPGEDVTLEDVAEAEIPEGDEGEENETGLAERVVTIQGEVRQVLDPGAFLIGDPGVLEPEVLVLSPSTDFVDLGLDVTDVLVEEETVVEVTGTVRRLSLGEFQEDYAIPYDPNIFDEYAGESIIVAERLEITEGRG